MIAILAFDFLAQGQTLEDVDRTIVSACNELNVFIQKETSQRWKLLKESPMEFSLLNGVEVWKRAPWHRKYHRTAIDGAKKI